MHTLVNFFGGKYRLARKYGPPRHDHVIEPFAGFANYSVYWEPKRVTLIERDPLIVGVWRYLQHPSAAAAIMRLPTGIDSLDELPPRICQEARDLIGFWFNRGLVRPAPRRANWARSGEYRFNFWDQQIRWRIASQVERIRHWDIREGTWQDAPDVEAHWFVDAPYVSTGGAYTHNHIDRTQLADWCKRRPWFGQVCEADGATWLPFRPFAVVRTPRGFAVEAIYEIDRRDGSGTAS